MRANALATSVGYASVEALKDLVGDSGSSYMYDFLQHERPST
jgi:hypothetical protein